ncbi:MAG: hypothetical protein PHP64_02820 [Actinomycetota bacterium]|nr:hypothetical protein [Actinomycetota bacterium]
MMEFSLRFWAENITPAEIARNAIPYLVEFRAGVAIAMREEELHEESARALREIKESGIEVTFWPLLSVEDGYFPSERSFREYESFLERLIAWASENGVLPDIVAFDLELPFSQMTRVVEARGLKIVPTVIEVLKENLNKPRFLEARKAFDALNLWVKSQSMKTLAAIFPFVLIDFEKGYGIVEDLMETPVTGIDWDFVSPMFYVSMISGMSGGLVSTKDANWLTHIACMELRDLIGERAAISLGVTGTGILGNESCFSHPDELVIGLGGALAAGIRDISIYNLEGILESREPREWFEAIRKSRPRMPLRSGKVQKAVALSRFLYPWLAKFLERFA